MFNQWCVSTSSVAALLELRAQLLRINVKPFRVLWLCFLARKAEPDKEEEQTILEPEQQKLEVSPENWKCCTRDEDHQEGHRDEKKKIESW